ncbi:hypothetical protein VZT92_025131 [Zoarces viviparus]|uniref:Uncharacterized protein n=1 Tax=Zoarces viviparus TaxID=48416 RepID=A0AAW1E409_ZOAVI
MMTKVTLSRFISPLLMRKWRLFFLRGTLKGQKWTTLQKIIPPLVPGDEDAVGIPLLSSGDEDEEEEAEGVDNPARFSDVFRNHGLEDVFWPGWDGPPQHQHPLHHHPPQHQGDDEKEDFEFVDNPLSELWPWCNVILHLTGRPQQERPQHQHPPQHQEDEEEEEFLFENNGEVFRRPGLEDVPPPELWPGWDGPPPPDFIQLVHNFFL